MIQLLHNRNPRWYRVQVRANSSGCTLSFPILARTSCEARIRALEHYKGEDVLVLAVHRRSA
ncbi:MAG: hypothetical protein ISQ08_04360 [Planctomycetes bacterium]|nr:hypothetical protein [Planctomycetota bacterium]MDA0946871.1 hypothetical protein [Planctomycetota bacterium]